MHAGHRVGRHRYRHLLLTGAAAVSAVALIGVGPQVAGASSKLVTQAKKALLQLTDLPKGWKVTKTSDTSAATSNTTKAVDEIATCEALSTSIDTSAPTAQDSFEDTEGVEFVSDLVSVFPSAKQAKSAYQLFSGAKASTCVGKQMAKSAASTTSSGITPTKVTTSSLTFPKYGQATTAIKVDFKVTTDDHVFPIQTDFVVLLQGKLVSILAIAASASSFPTTFAHGLAKKASARLS